MDDVSTAYDEWMASHNNDWSEDEHYLNYPGFLYMYYDKVKPMFGSSIDASIMEIRNRIDDENFYISCDSSINEVYIMYKEDNTILYDENIGELSDDGLLFIRVKSPESHIVGGYIDSTMGAITVVDASTGGIYSVVQGHASGDVNFLIDISL